jgi:hypothetical protein
VPTPDFILLNAAPSTTINIEVKTTASVTKRKYYVVVKGEDPNFGKIFV